MIGLKAAIVPDKNNPLRQFPIPVLLAVVTAAVFFIHLIEVGVENFSPPLLAVAFFVAFIASVAAYFLIRPAGTHEMLCHGASFAIAGVFFALGWFIVPQSLYLFVLGGFAVALIALAPIFYKAHSDEVWLHAIWVAIAAFLSVFVFIFWVSAFYTIQWMVNTLFPSKSHLDTVREIVIGFGIIFSLLFFLICLPSSTKLEEKKEQPLIVDAASSVYLRPVFDFLIVPIIFIIAFVLHIYAAAILLRQAFPDGQIGKMVTFYVCFVLGVRFAIHPFLAQARLLARVFSHIWSLLLLVPLAILLVAVTLRTSHYGMTINRYYLYLCALATILVVLAQIWPRWRGDIRVIALVPSFFLMVSVFGPWSVQNWVGYSQAQYLIRHYVTQGRLNFGRLNVAHIKNHQESYDDILQHIILLDETRQLSRLLPYIERDNRVAADFLSFDTTPRQLRRVKERPTRDAFMQALGFTLENLADDEAPIRVSDMVFGVGMAINRAPVIDMLEHDIVVPYMVISSDKMATDLGSEFIRAQIEGDRVTLHFQNMSDELSLPEFLARIPQADSKRIIDMETLAARAVRLIPLDVNLDGDDRVQRLVVTLMLRQEEWR